MTRQFLANLKELYWEGKNRKSIIGTLFMPLVLSLLVFIAVNEMMFQSFMNTKVSLFIFSIALIWIGIFNSITAICSIRAKIKVQYIQGMRISSFIFANVVYQFFKCVIQACVVSILFLAWGNWQWEAFPNAGVFFSPKIEFAITILMTIFSADMLGIMISSYCGDSVKAMTVMPVFLVIQMIFSNALFRLPEVNILNVHDILREIVSRSTISRWSIDALGTISNLSNMVDFIPAEAPDILFTYDLNHLFTCMEAMLIIATVCILIATMRLSRIKKESLF